MISSAGPSIVLALDEATKAGEARRAAQGLARRLGFGPTEEATVGLVVTELATNLHKHAVGGELIVQGLDLGRAVVVEVQAIDRGPGMVDVGRCMADGYSTAGSPGNGLGAVARQAGSFEVCSAPGAGTVAVARVWHATGPSRPPDGPDGLEVGVLGVPLAGERVSGDAWAVSEAEASGRDLVLMVDGLGHGLPAAEAAREAVAAFHAHARREPSEILLAAHDAMRGTRGAALAIARIDRDRGEVRYVGIGNISGVILAPGGDRRTSMVSQNGIVGHAIRRVQEFAYDWVPGATLIMHSDGLATHWQVDRHPGLLARHPSVIAGVLYRDHRRGRDDVTVLVAREKEEGWGP